MDLWVYGCKFGPFSTLGIFHALGGITGGMMRIDRDNVPPEFSDYPLN
jgi:hypothetical protein